MAPAAKLGRLAVLVEADADDVLRPPAYDAVVLLAAVLSAVLSSVVPLSSPAALVRNLMDPAMVVAALFMVARASFGVASLVSGGGIQVYMSYPVSRLAVILALLVARVLLPSLVVLGASLAAGGLLLFRVVLRDPLVVVGVFLGCLLFTTFIGTVFVFIALLTRRPGASAALSVAFYFAYTITPQVLTMLGGLAGSEALIDAGRAMGFVDVFTEAVLGRLEEGWLLAPVPVAEAVLLCLLVWYFSRRFEPV